MTFLYFSLCYLLIVIVLIMVYSFLRRKEQHEIIIHYNFYLIVLDHFLDKAYDIIYKDQIFIYSLEAMRLDENQVNDISKQFISLVLKLLGSEQIQIFVRLFGNEDTFYFYIITYFSLHYEGDRLRKTALDNISEGRKPDDFGQTKISLLDRIGEA